MSRDDNATTQGLIAFLQGYGKNNRDGLSAIAKFGAWPLLAARESERSMVKSPRIIAAYRGASHRPIGN
ncbi:MAG: hypothetical protein ACN6O5_15185 [Achromobacter sp.]|uniref:hypothetical protein n=1 Tax=Achromobacter sp. TaxID=134375 RepID=UPI003CFF58E5